MGGVLFGWLGDRIGRVRAMTLSVLTYALFTGLCGFAGEAWQVGILRFIAALGMGGEWSLGVVLVMEVWPNKSRAFTAGLTALRRMSVTCSLACWDLRCCKCWEAFAAAWNRWGCLCRRRSFMRVTLIAVGG